MCSKQLLLGICFLLSLLTGVVQAALSQAALPFAHAENSRRALTEQVSSNNSHFSEQISNGECRDRDLSAILDNIKGGKALPYAFVGPPQYCTAPGCKNEYWGRRCRFDGFHTPACPEEDRWRMAAWLAEQADKGAAWARDTLTIEPCDLWPQLKGRTVWVAGDSISQDLAFGLACFMVEYMANEPGRDIAPDPATMRSLTHSINGKELTTWCFNMTHNTRVCSLRANKAHRMASTILRLLPSIADRDADIVILNFGSWYNWMADGMSELEGDMPKFEEAIRAHREALPRRLFWRESTAQHFNTVSGMFDWQLPIGEQRCAPPGQKLGVQLEMRPDRSLARTADSRDPSDWWELDVMLSGGHRNRATQPTINRLGIETLMAWNLSLIIHDVHKSYHRADSGGECITVECDCSHACSPSWYQMMLADFNQALQRFDSSGVAVS